MDLVSEWLEMARSDYNVAKNTIEDWHPKEIKISAYHSTQAVEKALKAFLIYKDIDPPYTHDLDLLRQKCSDVDSGFDEFEVDCSNLKKYAVTTRYPSELQIPEKEAVNAVQKAKQIFEFAYDMIPNLSESLKLDTEIEESEEPQLTL
jgi:HEPN domain-containing protein